MGGWNLSGAREQAGGRDVFQRKRWGVMLVEGRLSARTVVLL